MVSLYCENYNFSATLANKLDPNADSNWWKVCLWCKADESDANELSQQRQYVCYKWGMKTQSC